MSNLLPAKAKKTITFEYWVRTISVWTALLSFALLIVFALCLPAYVLVSARLAAAKLEATERKVQETADRYESTSRTIKKANEIAALLSATPGTPLASAILADVEKEITGDILLRGISYTPADEAALVIQGTARTRESLVSFVDALKSSPNFGDVEIPISDLARSTDAPFAVTVSLQRK